MNTDDKQKILRYTELVLRHNLLTRLQKIIAPEEDAERNRLRVELGMSHEEILDRAVKSLIEELE